MDRIVFVIYYGNFKIEQIIIRDVIKNRFMWYLCFFYNNKNLNVLSV